jgi:SAM-dependent methyltransferase
MGMSDSIIDSINCQTKKRYGDRFAQFGYSPVTLGWNKGKQFERFHQLTSEWGNMSGSSFLDIGCGFGDFLKFLDISGVKDYSYTGIDITPELIAKAQEIFSNPGNIISPPRVSTRNS